jgi:hypothetical protein
MKFFRNTISWSYFVAYPLMILTILTIAILPKTAKKGHFLKIEKNGQNIKFFYFLYVLRIMYIS